LITVESRYLGAAGGVFVCVPLVPVAGGWPAGGVAGGRLVDDAGAVPPAGALGACDCGAAPLAPVAGAATPDLAFMRVFTSAVASQSLLA